MLESLRKILGETFLIAARVDVIFLPLFLLLLLSNFLFEGNNVRVDLFLSDSQFFLQPLQLAVNLL